MKPGLLNRLTVVVVGLVLGWGIAWSLQPKLMRSQSHEMSSGAKAPPAEAVVSTIATVAQLSPEGFRALLDNPRFAAREVWLRWAETDPVSCYAEMVKRNDWVFVSTLEAGLSFPGPPAADKVIKTLFNTWVAQNPAAAFKAMVVMPSGFRATLALPELLNKIVATNPLAAVEFVRLYGNGIGSFQHTEIAWAGVDLPNLAKSASDLGNGIYCKFFLDKIAREYGRQDPEGALSWVRSLQRPNKSQLLQEIFVGWTQSAPQQAMTALLQMTDPVERKAAAPPLAKLLANEPPAQAWVAAKQAGFLPEMHATLAQEWGQKDPSAAVNFLVTLQSEYQDEALREAFWPWRFRDPKAAGAAAAALPAGPAKRRIVKELIREWSAADPVAAATFLGAEPYHRDNAELARTIAHSWADQAPASAVAWVQQLPESTQGDSMRSVFYSWAKQDPAAAKVAAEQITDQKQHQKAIEGMAQAGH